MSYNLKVLEPVVGDKLKIEYSWPADVEVVNIEGDTDYHRYVVFFCVKKIGNAGGTKTFDTPWVQFDENTPQHSLSAMMVESNTIVKRDRRMVRSGQSEA